VYSLGIVFWEIFHCELPYEKLSISPIDLLIGVQNGQLRPSISPEKMKCFPEMVKIMKDAWQDDPKKRPSAHSLKEKISLIQIVETQ